MILKKPQNVHQEDAKRIKIIVNAWNFECVLKESGSPRVDLLSPSEDSPSFEWWEVTGSGEGKK